MQRRLRGGEWDGPGPPAGAQEGLQEAGGVCREEPVSLRLTGLANRQGGSCCGRSPETAGQGVDGNHRESAEMVATACHREWGQGGGRWEFPALCSALQGRVWGVGWQEIWEGGVGPRVGWQHPACVAW